MFNHDQQHSVRGLQKISYCLPHKFYLFNTGLKSCIQHEKKVKPLRQEALSLSAKESNTGGDHRDRRLRVEHLLVQDDDDGDDDYDVEDLLVQPLGEPLNLLLRPHKQRATPLPLTREAPVRFGQNCETWSEFGNWVKIIPLAREAPVKLSARLSRLEEECSGKTLHIEHCAALGSHILYCVPVVMQMSLHLR